MIYALQCFTTNCSCAFQKANGIFMYGIFLNAGIVQYPTWQKRTYLNISENICNIVFLYI